jgi:hypothetical protein
MYNAWDWSSAISGGWRDKNSGFVSSCSSIPPLHLLFLNFFSFSSYFLIISFLFFISFPSFPFFLKKKTVRGSVAKPCLPH